MPSSRTSPDANFSGAPVGESAAKFSDVNDSTQDFNPLLNRQLENPTS